MGDRASDYVVRFLGPEQREIVLMENGKVSRRIAGDVGEFLEHLYMPDVYYSVRTVYDILMDTWSRIVLDVDAHDGMLSGARETAQSLIAYLDVNGIEPNVVFTGRGYQVVLILSERVELDVDGLRRELSRLEIERLDLSVLNSNPVARLPYTYNSKAGRLAVPVNPYDLETEDTEVRTADASRLQALFGSVRPRHHGQVKRTAVGFSGSGILPLCIMRMICSLALTGELDHHSRFTLAVFLLREYGYDTAVRVFQRAGDYNHRMTDYQLRHIASRRYMYPRCSKIAEMGWCNPNVKCPFRPWLEPYLAWWDDAQGEDGTA